ncbi:40S ribosomal protein S19 [Manis javanica]|nr:40S ribosomal protein S19 [Manis javanica]
MLSVVRTDCIHELVAQHSPCTFRQHWGRLHDQNLRVTSETSCPMPGHVSRGSKSVAHWALHALEWLQVVGKDQDEGHGWMLQEQTDPDGHRAAGSCQQEALEHRCRVNKLPNLLKAERTTRTKKKNLNHFQFPKCTRLPVAHFFTFCSIDSDPTTPVRHLLS